MTGETKPSDDAENGTDQPSIGPGEKTWPKDPNGFMRQVPDLRDVFYTLGLVTLVVAILTLAAEQLAPVALAVLIWFLINAIATGIRDLVVGGRHLPEWLALTIAAVGTIGFIVLAGRLVVSNIQELTEGLTGIDQKLASAIQGLAALVGFDGQVGIADLARFITIEEVMERIFSSVTNTASGISIVVMFVLFLLLDQPYYDMKLRALFPNPDHQRRVRAVLEKITADTRAYVWLMTLVSVGVGFLTYVIASTFGLKGAAFWGFLAFALNYIPTVGSFLGVLFPTAFAIVQFDDVSNLVGFAVALGVVQFVMGNILLPRMAGDRLNLSQFVVILSLSVWGAMWGVLGLFLAVPLMMVLAIVLAQFESTRPVAILLSQKGRVMRQQALKTGQGISG